MQIDMKQPILQKNDSIAAELRQRFADNRVYVVDLLASPGSGKTTVAVKLAARLASWRPSTPCATSSTSPSSKATSPAASTLRRSRPREPPRCRSTPAARAIWKAP